MSQPTLRRRTGDLRATLMAACVGVSMLAGGAARAGIFDDDEARKAIGSLRAQIEDLQRQNREAQAQNTQQVDNLKRSILDLNNQIEALRTEIARARGQDEQSGQATRDVARDLAETQRRQKDTIAALEERLRRLEPQRVSLDGREVQVAADERKAYDDAVALLRNGDFGGASLALQAFQRRYPASPYGGHVLYWLGNAQYGLGQLKDALASFRTLAQTQPTHPRAAEALLSAANCQAELKDTKGARATLGDLLRGYPDSEAAEAGRKRLALLK